MYDHVELYCIYYYVGIHHLLAEMKLKYYKGKFKLYINYFYKLIVFKYKKV